MDMWLKIKPTKDKKYHIFAYVNSSTPSISAASINASSRIPTHVSPIRKPPILNTHISSPSTPILFPQSPILRKSPRFSQATIPTTPNAPIPLTDPNLVTTSNAPITCKAKREIFNVPDTPTDKNVAVSPTLRRSPRKQRMSDMPSKMINFVMMQMKQTWNLSM
ncbi:hypothetical protein FRX31_030703 [Thalictrum thalictroides]|uniref:Uncharacterized protein n=1 Tax=Thalictrum thalictroides TaxID=46969 RepID=A0A7J6V694_THATH|nr:hypothetical protein FRX31_030703 [Thalictrum thalictroides]